MISRSTTSPYGGSRLCELADVVASKTEVISQYIQATGLKEPSFDAEGPVDFNIKDSKVEDARVCALEACLELHDLLQGPRQNLRPRLNGIGLQAVYQWDLAKHVPLEGEISFSELASKCGENEADVRRVVRFVSSWHRVFKERQKGYVAHTAASRLLVTDEVAWKTLGYHFEEVWQAFAHTLKARDMFPGSTEPNHTGWSVAMQTSKGVFEYYGEHPENADRFSAVMHAASSGAAFQNSLLASAIPWKSLKSNTGQGSTLVVDVGGSRGHVSAGIAAIAPNVRCICQDLPEAIAGAMIPAAVADRVEMMPYNFFQEQPIVGAEVYLFSHIFHNWSDAHVVKIIRNQIPALRPGSKLVITDAILPEPNTLSLLQEREVRSMDMIMMSMFNSREREKDDWLDILKQAHPGFGDVLFHIPGTSAWGVVEATWKGES